MRRAIALACWLVAATSSGLAQAQAFAIDARAPRYAPVRTSDAPLEGRLPDSKDVAMPWVHGGPPGMATRINDAIYLQVLNTLAPRTPGDTFAAPADSALQYFCDISFSVGRNDGRVLSIKLPIETRGAAHCSDGSHAYHFDAATGRELAVDELFTADGLAALIQRRNDAAAEAFEQALADLPPDPNAPEEDADAESDTSATPATRPASSSFLSDPDYPVEQQREFFQGCAWTWRSYANPVRLDIELPAAGGLIVHVPLCAGDNHHMRVIDATPDALPISVAELEPLLSAYGRRLLLGKGNAPAPADLFGRTLRGLVGTMPVTLHLGKPWGDKHEVEAFYAYDRIGVGITMFGNAEGDAIELREEADKGFKLRRVGSALVGTWHGSGKRLPVRLD